jgi:hypothetical protein
MTSVTTLAAASLISLAPAQADGLGGLVRQGMSKVGEGAQAVGRGVSNVGKSVDNSIRETERAMTNGEDPVAKRAELDAMATSALQRLFEEEPRALDLFRLSSGYAVFDTRRLSVVGVAAGGGKGVAVSRTGDRRIYMNMGLAGVAMEFGFGGFATQQVIFFETPWDFENFLASGFDARAEAGAMVGKDAERLALNFVNGRAVFALTGQGWKVSATATGTKYWADRVLNAAGP